MASAKAEARRASSGRPASRNPSASVMSAPARFPLSTVET